MLGQWQCPDSTLGLGWEFPEISLCLKLNVGQMQTLGRQSSFVFCLSMHPTSIYPETRGDFLLTWKETPKNCNFISLLHLFHLFVEIVILYYILKVILVSVCRSRRQLLGIGSVLPSCGSQGQNSGWQLSIKRLSP